MIKLNFLHSKEKSYLTLKISKKFENFWIGRWILNKSSKACFILEDLLEFIKKCKGVFAGFLNIFMLQLTQKKLFRMNLIMEGHQKLVILEFLENFKSSQSSLKFFINPQFSLFPPFMRNFEWRKQKNALWMRFLLQTFFFSSFNWKMNFSLTKFFLINFVFSQTKKFWKKILQNFNHLKKIFFIFFDV